MVQTRWDRRFDLFYFERSCVAIRFLLRCRNVSGLRRKIVLLINLLYMIRNSVDFNLLFQTSIDRSLFQRTNIF